MPRSCRAWIVLPLLWAFFALLVGGIRRNELVVDEPTHIAAGYAYLAQGREALWLQPEHRTAPLANALAASLLYLAGPRVLVESLHGWQTSLAPYVNSLIAELPSAPLQFLARMPMVLLSTTLAALIFRWGRQLGGLAAGLLATVVFVLDPNVLAHGRLATTDMAITATGMFLLYCGSRLWHKPNWKTTLGTGGLLGLTLLAKHTGVIWLGVWVLAGGIRALDRRLDIQQRRRTWLAVGASAATGLVVLWLAYGLTFGPVAGWPVPLPAPDYWASLAAQSGSSTSRWTFAFGFRHYGGWWWYFPAAFLVKNPLPYLTALVVSIACIRRAARRLWLPLLVAVVYVASAVWSNVNIGYRHLLPLHPSLALLMGVGLGGWLTHAGRWRPYVGVLLAVLGLSYAAGTLRAWPNELSSFNALVGGPEQRYRYLVDSNLDWGQVSAHAVQPSLEGYAPLFDTAPRTIVPAAGSYLVNASTLQGLGPEGPFAYEWFRNLKPEAVLEAVWLVYRVEPPAYQWLAQCRTTGMPLDPAEALAQVGLPPATRQIDFDCRQGWIYPGNGEAGLYLLTHDLYAEPQLKLDDFTAGLPKVRDEFMAQRLAQTRLAYDRSQAGELPAFVLNELTANVEPEFTRTFFVAAAATAPVALGDADRTRAVTAGTEMELVGVRTTEDGEHFEAETWWRVKSPLPAGRPFSIMAHVLTSDGQLLAAGDGLAIATDQLMVGDVVVQRHVFDQASRPDLWLRTGIYWLEGLQRWPINGRVEHDAVFVPLIDQP